MRDEEVVSIEVAPFVGQVFNLTVAVDESYVLNGIVAHNCLCYKTAVLPDADDFARRLRGWLTGAEDWPQMDEYAGWLGVTGADLVNVSLATRLAQQLVTWLWGDQAAMDAAAASDVLAGAQLALPNI